MDNSTWLLVSRWSELAEQIVDMMEAASREGDVDGFLLELAITDYSALVEFVDKVVPVAQRRG